MYWSLIFPFFLSKYLFIAESSLLKSPMIISLPISTFTSFNICLVQLGALMLDAYTYIQQLYLLGGLTYLFCILYTFWLKIYCVLFISITTPALFWFLFSGNIFFPFFYFQHICGFKYSMWLNPFFKIQSDWSLQFV